MKTILGSVLFLVSALALSAQTNIVVTFEPRNPPGSVEYFVELRMDSVANPVWEEKAKGNGSPIAFQIPAQPVGARISGRVRARHLLSGKVTEPSNETFDFVPPVTPGQSVIIVSRVAPTN